MLFSGSQLDRKSHIRGTEFESAINKTILFNSISPVLNSTGQIAFEDRRGSIYLGTAEDVAYWADSTSLKGTESRDAIFKLNGFEGSIFSVAKSIVDWNMRYKYCPSCSFETEMGDHGWKRCCSNVSCESKKGVQNYAYPRTDGVVIVNIISADGKRILLGRQARWPKGRYSCVAGFVEPGESLEEAVSREALEETGLDIERVEYQLSQPWPFPSQLMLGFSAVAKSEIVDITSRDLELEDAKWFTKDQIRAALRNEGPITLAPPYAIANTLITRWASQ